MKTVASLKRRILISGLAVVLLSLALLAMTASYILRAEMERVLGDQQVATVSLVSAEIVESFRERTEALQLLAQSIDSATLQQPERLQQLLEQRKLTMLLFNAGIFVTDRDGLALAELPKMGRTGVNYLDRDHIAAALRAGRVAVGKPVIGKRVMAPSFAITVPIKDAQGQVIGAIAGVIDLSRPNFLDSFTASHYGRTGGYLIVDPQSRLFVSATANNRKLIMQPLPAPGVNAVLDRRLLGFDGPAVNVSSLGVEVLTASGRIPLAGWIVIATLPTAEAFAPVRAMERSVLWSAMGVMLAAVLLMGWRLRALLRPLALAAREVASFNAEATTPKALAIEVRDEVGQLIDGFNHMLEVAAGREDELRVSGAVLQNMQGGVCLVQVETGQIVFTNPKFDALFGYAEGELLGRAVSVLNAPSVSTPEQLAAEIMAELTQHGAWQGDVENLRKDGGRFWSHAAVSVLPHQRYGSVWVAVHQDISEHKASTAQLASANELLVSLAAHDALTGLFNRRGLQNMAERQLSEARRAGQPVSFILLDIDHFKHINDRHGHLAGDAVIREIGQLLLSVCRDSDVACRYGGEEFLLLLPRTSLDSALRRAEQLRQAVSERLIIHEAQSLHVTMSLGVATFPESGSKLEDLIAQADHALYEAKQAGRNQVRSAGPGPSGANAG
ncbi:diguanylate cyclase [Paucibacter sp. DJ1R-11]|uniref:sensor domain-containing diguanylate cyclase n=1 Tax=Paucibacter sp. DJ1R-11 TaxID=2893556 RepID=UPI0021E4CADA|nr:diguanylate cyclase [Paucibacter sp. DJ1R-11]MCV2362171.1 diguanylate cyclase [Paucibacter sp. DJ1R-11]